MSNMDGECRVESNQRESASKKRTRRVGIKRIEFIGWASKPLIEFLEATGEDTSKAHSRHEVGLFIRKYINTNGLSDGKKKILCDERLHALFGKKTILQKRIYELLEEHFYENHDDSDDDSLDNSEEEDSRKKCCSGSKIPSIQIQKVPKSCFAAVIPDNIKLIYLKKSLIRELLKVPESFKSKILGSFVRMKSDPNDVSQKNPFQLQLVTGIEKFTAAVNAGADKIQLKVANFFKDVPFSMLSDDNFSKEEVEDVQKRIEAGALKKFTVNEIELKACLLHADITKHWIAKELSLLEKRIDHANDKGWRRELFEYLDRRKMLQTTSEVEKLLSNIPEVIAEELFSEDAIAPASRNEEGSFHSSKLSALRSSDVSCPHASVSVDPPTSSPLHDSHPRTVPITTVDGPLLVRNAVGDQQAPAIGAADTTCHESSATMLDMIAGDEKMVMQTEFSTETAAEGKQENLPGTCELIELSDDDDDDDDDDESKEDNIPPAECPNVAIWHYADPRGKIRGPFSLQALKRWHDANYFCSGFMVWKSAQTENEGILLVDVLRRSFPVQTE